MFEWDDDLLAVSVIEEISDRSAQIAFIGVDADRHGARIDSDDGDRLSDAVLGATLDIAEDLGFKRVVAQVAKSHDTSLRLLGRAGFTKASEVDHDYALFAVES